MDEPTEKPSAAPQDRERLSDKRSAESASPQERELDLRSASAKTDPGSHYRLLEPGRAGSRLRGKCAAALSQVIEAVACDVAERDRRIIMLASRRSPREEAIELAGLLGSHRVWEGQKNQPLSRLAEEVQLCLEEHGGGPACFIETTDLANIERGMGIGAQLHLSNTDTSEIEDLLRQSDAWLVLAIELEGRHTLDHAYSHVHGSYVLPWTYSWFRDLARKSHVADDAFLALRDKLDLACDARLRRGTELMFFEEMASLEPEAAFFGYDRLLERVQGALDAVRSDAHDRKEKAIARLDALFDERRNGPSLGEIGKVLVAISLFSDRQPFESVIWLACELLPDSEIPFDLLTPGIRETWQRIAGDSERMGGARPDLPVWRDLLLQDPDQALLACGLQRESGAVKPLQISRQIDARAILCERRSHFLRSLLLRIGERRLPMRAESEHLVCLVQFQMMLTLELRAWEDHAIIRAFAGMIPSDRDLPLLPDEARDAHMLVEMGTGRIEGPKLKTLADIQDCIDNLAWRDRSSLDALRSGYERWQLGAAKRLADSLLILHGLRASDEQTVATFDVWLSSLCRDLPAQTMYLVLALLNFNGGSIQPAMLATITYRSLWDETPSRRVQNIVDLKNIWSSILYNAARLELEGELRDGPPPIEAWADGLALVARQQTRDAWLAGFSSFADDFFSNHEIGWNFRLEKDRARTSAILANRVLLAQPDESPEPDLLMRLLARDPVEWIGRLREFAASMIQDETPRFDLPGHVSGRLHDVIAVLFGGMAREDRDRLNRKGNRDAMARSTWRVLTQSLGGFEFDNAAHGAALALKAIAANPSRERDEACEILALYPAAILAEWRFLIFGPGRLLADADGYGAFLGRMTSIRTSLSGSDALKRLIASLKALHVAQAALASTFEDMELSATADTYRLKSESFHAMHRFFRPPDNAANPLPITALQPASHLQDRFP